MKSDHSPKHKCHHNLNHEKNLYAMTRAFAFLLFFLIGYALGFFAGPRSYPPVTTHDETPATTLVKSKVNPPPPPPPAQEPPQQPPHEFFRFLTSCSLPLQQSKVLPTLLSKLSNNTSPYDNFPSPHIRPFLRHSHIHGWGSTNTVFEYVINLVKPRTIVEVGSFLGASALHMANVTRTIGLTDTIILCVDDFRGWPGFRDSNGGIFKNMADLNGDVVLLQQFMQNVVDADEEDRVIPVPFASGAGLDALCQWGVLGDLVVVDAGHNFHAAWEDINRAWKVLRTGGVMFGHDYFNGADDFGVQKAVDLFAKIKGLRVEPNGEHWVLLPPKSSP